MPAPLALAPPGDLPCSCHWDELGWHWGALSLWHRTAPPAAFPSPGKGCVTWGSPGRGPPQIPHHEPCGRGGEASVGVLPGPKSAVASKPQPVGCPEHHATGPWLLKEGHAQHSHFQPSSHSQPPWQSLGCFGSASVPKPPPHAGHGHCHRVPSRGGLGTNCHLCSWRGGFCLRAAFLDISISCLGVSRSAASAQSPWELMGASMRELVLPGCGTPGAPQYGVGGAPQDSRGVGEFPDCRGTMGWLILQQFGDSDPGRSHLQWPQQGPEECAASLRGTAVSPWS